MYTKEQKCLTMVNSLANHSDWNQMCFSGMHTFNICKEVWHQVEIESECLLEATSNKAQSTIMIVQAKPKEKNNMGDMVISPLKKPDLITMNEEAIKNKHCPNKAGKVHKS